ncbi:MAG TPA: hypothetical protein VKC60_15760 [Opitutaceae bacterium]|nr:hypothetical protein [Opitutaceae bacterium]
MNEAPAQKRLVVRCSGCRKETTFDQPYAYHAGFSDQGFLYNDAGNLTLVFGAYDPKFASVFGNYIPWTKEDKAKKIEFEASLPPAPTGGRWRFANPARCPHCGATLSGPITECISYLIYPGSIIVSDLRQITIDAKQLTEPTGGTVTSGADAPATPIPPVARP